MVHGAHLDPGSPALLEAARAAFESGGTAWTDLRRAVFSALLGAPGPVSAYDVADTVSAGLGRRVAANSIYRILDLLVFHNLAKRVESRNAYVANTHPACAHDCIFLVCTRCGRIDHLDDDHLAGHLRQRAEAAGFAPVRPVVEVIGLCGDCVGAETGARPLAGPPQ